MSSYQKEQIGFNLHASRLLIVAKFEALILFLVFMETYGCDA